MTLRAIAALLRAAWYTARSYRVSLLFQIGGILVTVVPMYFIATALQPTMARVIATEADQYFPFLLVGSIALMMVTSAMSSLPSAISGGISSGYFEALLMTRAPVGSILAGLSTYPLLLVLLRSAVMMTGAWIIGAQVAWGQIVPALLILALIVVAHWGVALIAASLVIAFRTSGPVLQVAMALTALFGGVYYPVTVIPSWLGTIAELTPMSYGLRALRRVLLRGDGIGDVATDVGMVLAVGVLLLMIGSASIQVALRYGRKSGTLGTY